MKTKVKKERCIHCREKKIHSRGCCFNHYQQIRRAVKAGIMTWDKAAADREVLPRRKPGPKGRYEQ